MSEEKTRDRNSEGLQHVWGQQVCQANLSAVCGLPKRAM